MIIIDDYNCGDEIDDDLGDLLEDVHNLDDHNHHHDVHCQANKPASRSACLQRVWLMSHEAGFTKRILRRIMMIIMMTMMITGIIMKMMMMVMVILMMILRLISHQAGSDFEDL